jgi:hypothetical protein
MVMRRILLLGVVLFGCDRGSNTAQRTPGPRDHETHGAPLPVEGQLDLELSPIIVRLLKLRQQPPSPEMKKQIDDLLLAMLEFQCAGEQWTPDLTIYDAVASRNIAEIRCYFVDFGNGEVAEYDKAVRRWVSRPSRE